MSEIELFEKTAEYAFNRTLKELSDFAEILTENEKENFFSVFWEKYHLCAKELFDAEFKQ